MSITIQLNGKSFVLENGQKCTVGRVEGVDFVIEDNNVSRKHCTLRLQGEKLYIEDHNSTCGTFIGKHRVKGAQNLKLSQAIYPFRVADIQGQIEYRSANAVESEAQPIPIESARAKEEVPSQPQALVNNSAVAASAAATPKRPASRNIVSCAAKGYERTYYEGSFSDALSLTLQTMPFVLAKMGVVMAFSIAALVYWVVMTFIFGMGAKATEAIGGDGIMQWAYIISLIAPAGVFYWLRKYVLYMLKAAHIAVLTELIFKNEVPRAGMVEYGKTKVTENFGQVNIMFAIDSLVAGVVSAFNGTLDFITSFIPIPGLHSVVGFAKQVVRMATSYIDECVLSYNFTRHGENPWQSSVDGVILYAQNSKPILKTAIWAVCLNYVFSFIGTLMVYIFVGGLLSMLMPSLGIVAIAFSAVVAYSFHYGFFQPLFLVMILAKYHKESVGEEPNPEWKAKLASISSKFQELLNNAKEKLAA